MSIMARIEFQRRCPDLRTNRKGLRREELRRILPDGWVRVGWWKFPLRALRKTLSKQVSR